MSNANHHSHLFTILFCTLCSTLFFVLFCFTDSSVAQEKQTPFDINACFSDGKTPKVECEILSCMSRLNLTRENCNCLRGCATKYVQCFNAETKAGTAKEAADLSCNAIKNHCATECFAKK